MAVWDLNSNLDVFSMQTFLRGLIYVRWAIQAHLSLLFSSASVNLVLKSFMTARPDLCSLIWLVYFLLLFLTLVCDTYNVINVMLLVCWKLKPLLDAVIETYIWKTFGKLFRITKFMSIANIPNIVMYW